MANRILRASVNLVGGLLQGTIEFEPGLNLISGENGTLKTKLLQSLKGNTVERSDPNVPLVTQSISPKRNSERRAAEGILQFFRQHNRTWDTELTERVGAQIKDTGFENYPSLGELFYYIFQHRCKDGSDRKAHMEAVVEQFNAVIQAVFPQYELMAEWDAAGLGEPRIRMRKLGKLTFPIEDMSLGEQEVLSLIANMDAAKDRVDCYLIDEPEVHLNWHLEERLFEFIDALCRDHGKQAIVVTHSRIIFKPEFLSRVQFLHWNLDGQVKWSRTLSPAQRKRLAGDALEVIALGEFSKPTVFLEDTAHVELLETLAEHFNVQFAVSKCGNSSNVRALFEHQRHSGGWPHTYFLVDGDNQGNPFPLENQFFQWPAYCVENFFLDPDLLSEVLERDVAEIQDALLRVIRTHSTRLYKNNKFLVFAIEGVKAADLTYERLSALDGSLLLEPLCAELGVLLKDFAALYVKRADETAKLKVLLPPGLLAIMEAPVVLEAVATATAEEQPPP